MPSANLLHHERLHWHDGADAVAGVDEAGRGPLAGPVVAAAVVFLPAAAEAALVGPLAGLTDSKQLGEADRAQFFQYLYALDGVDIGVGVSASPEIDAVNILRATHLAMARAVSRLHKPPGHILVDGLPVPGLPVASTAIVKGDSLSFSIAAASVIAKVTRDRMMIELDARYPGYGFARHKGYGTAFHMQALLELGCTPVHRMSFRPVREAAEIHAGRGPVQRELFV
ncbi:MAG: ribonuclease HII [Kiritimatiellia bacterium]